MTDPEEILSELTPETSGDWRTVGKVCQRLYSLSEVSGAGQLWHDVVLEATAAHGHKISSGHLHRVRRAYDFLIMGMSLRKIPQKRMSLAKISSIDQAERLYQLDPDAGLDALEACLDFKKPATLAEIRRRYDAYLGAHPEKKKAMQLAWDRRRQPDNKAAATQGDTAPEASDAPDIEAAFSLIAKHVTEYETLTRKQARKIADLERKMLAAHMEIEKTKLELQNLLRDLKEMQDRVSRQGAD